MYLGERRAENLVHAQFLSIRSSISTDFFSFLTLSIIRGCGRILFLIKTREFSRTVVDDSLAKERERRLGLKECKVAVTVRLTSMLLLRTAGRMPRLSFFFRSGVWSPGERGGLKETREAFEYDYLLVSSEENRENSLSFFS